MIASKFIVSILIFLNSFGGRIYVIVCFQYAIAFINE